MHALRVQGAIRSDYPQAVDATRSEFSLQVEVMHLAIRRTIVGNQMMGSLHLFTQEQDSLGASEGIPMCSVSSVYGDDRYCTRRVEESK